MEEFKLVVLEKSESENPVETIDIIFGIFSRSRLGALEKQTH